MSTTADTNRIREVQFALGTFTGMSIIALGVAFYILAVSMGVRETAGGYLPDALETSVPILGVNVLVFGGLVLLFAGLVGRLYRPKFPEDLQSTVKTLSLPVIVVGVGVFSFGFSPQTTTSAPWFATGEAAREIANGLPITVFPLLFGTLTFSVFQISRLRRGRGILSPSTKRALVWASLGLVGVSLLPSVVYVLGLLFGGMAGPEAATLVPTPVYEVGGGTQKVVLLVFAIEMVLAGYAILRTAAHSVGW